MSNSTCSINDCSNAVLARGWCSKHYNRWRINKLDGHENNSAKRCAVSGCNGLSEKRGWCQMHYRRWQTHGDPLRVINEITERPEESFKIRTEWQGNCLIWAGSRNDNDYGQIWIDGQMRLAHRFSWQQSCGPIPDGMFIDHICHNPPCVNPDHLRLATNAENMANRSGPASNNTTGYRNVYRQGNGWSVQVWKDGRKHTLGNYKDIEVAAKVAEDARKKLFGEFAGKG